MPASPDNFKKATRFHKRELGDVPLSATVIEALAAAGCSMEQIVAAARATELADSDRAQARREAERLRKRRQREKEKIAETTIASAMSRVTSVTERDIPSPPPSPLPKEIPQTPLEITLFPEPPPQPRFPSAREFDTFWARFPNKVGKADAFKAFDRAVKRVDIVALMAGLDRYVSKTDDRPWCNPATWLNQDRWADQPAQVARASPRRLTGLAAITENLRQELENDGYGQQGEEGGDRFDDARVPLIAGPRH